MRSIHSSNYLQLNMFTNYKHLHACFYNDVTWCHYEPPFYPSFETLHERIAQHFSVFSHVSLKCTWFDIKHLHFINRSDDGSLRCSKTINRIMFLCFGFACNRFSSWWNDERKNLLFSRGADWRGAWGRERLKLY